MDDGPDAGHAGDAVAGGIPSRQARRSEVGKSGVMLTIAPDPKSGARVPLRWCRFTASVSLRLAVNPPPGACARSTRRRYPLSVLDPSLKVKRSGPPEIHHIFGFTEGGCASDIVSGGAEAMAAIENLPSDDPLFVVRTALDEMFPKMLMSTVELAGDVLEKVKPASGS